MPKRKARMSTSGAIDKTVRIAIASTPGGLPPEGELRADGGCDDERESNRPAASAIATWPMLAMTEAYGIFNSRFRSIHQAQGTNSQVTTISVPAREFQRPSL